MDETLVSSRLAEVQDRAEENEITERVRVTMPMMLSMLSGAEEEMSASFQKELPRKLRRAAEVFADPKVENELSEDEKGVKAKERVVRKVESIFKKPHRVAGKLTLSERKFVEETGVDENAMSNEKVPV